MSSSQFSVRVKSTYEVLGGSTDSFSIGLKGEGVGLKDDDNVELSARNGEGV